MIKFKQYEETDFNNLVQCMEKLQDFIITLDPIKRLHRLQNHGKSYSNALIKKINKQKGIIILAYEKKKTIGCIAGIIEKQTKEDLLECVPTKTGRILELFVLDSYRNQGIGKELMKHMENHLKQKKCDFVRIEVFEPNKLAYNFYKKLGYSDRVIDLIKLID